MGVGTEMTVGSRDQHEARFVHCHTVRKASEEPVKTLRWNAICDFGHRTVSEWGEHTSYNLHKERQ